MVDVTAGMTAKILTRAKRRRRAPRARSTRISTRRTGNVGGLARSEMGVMSVPGWWGFPDPSQGDPPGYGRMACVAAVVRRTIAVIHLGFAIGGTSVDQQAPDGGESKPTCSQKGLRLGTIYVPTYLPTYLVLGF